MPASKVTPKPNDGTALVALDPWLEPYAPHLRARYAFFKSTLAKIDATCNRPTRPASQRLQEGSPMFNAIFDSLQKLQQRVEQPEA